MIMSIFKHINSNIFQNIIIMLGGVCNTQSLYLNNTSLLSWVNLICFTILSCQLVLSRVINKPISQNKQQQIDTALKTIDKIIGIINYDDARVKSSRVTNVDKSFNKFIDEDMDIFLRAPENKEPSIHAPENKEPCIHEFQKVVVGYDDSYKKCKICGYEVW